MPGPAAAIVNSSVGRDLIIKFLLGASRDDADSVRAYLTELAREANILPWGVLSEQFGSGNSAPPSVAEIYTDLDTARLEAETEPEARQFMLHIDRMRRVPVQEMADREDRLLITGDPGSGKSTFVKHTAYLLASAAQSQTPADVLATLDPWSYGALLPVYVELRQVAAFAADQKEKQGTVRLFTRYLAHLLDQWSIGSAWDAVRATLTDGETAALLLLDGLDEVSTAQRKLLVDMVNALSDDPDYGRHRIIVTCRPYAYYDMPADHRLRAFAEVTLAPFSTEQVDHFIVNWYRHLSGGPRPQYTAEEVAARLKDLRGAVRRRDHRSLARRPILLTMMVQLHTFKGRLPDDRVRLYKESIDLLLSRWNTRSHDQPTLREFLNLPNLKDEDVERALFEIAYNAHQAEPDSHDSDGEEEVSADITESDLLGWVRPYLNGSDPHAALFIQYIRERAGLLLRHKSDAYTFPHRSLQEFLAACYLTRSDDVNYHVDAAGLVRQDPTRWREVFVLAAGYEQRFGKTSNAVSAVNELCPANCPTHVDPERWTFAQIAGEALLEIGQVAVQRSESGRALWERVQHWLAALVEQPQLPLVKQRVAAGVTLAKLGDPRRAVTDPRHMEFCYVPPGPFRMGEGEEQYEHDLAYGYWIARFPVTNQHFKAFVDTGGYANPDYWHEATEHDRWRDGQVFRYYAYYDDKGEVQVDNGWFLAPHDYGEPFNLLNHPVVGVSWYEALAYTRWLAEQYRAAGLLPADLYVNLPNEPEWEKAGRGGLRLPAAATILPLSAIEGDPDPVLNRANAGAGRHYPWGDEAEPERANYRATEIGGTSAAGCFGAGASPYGVEELSGTVWEWTRSLWGKAVDKASFGYPYLPDDGREELAAGTNTGWVLRGGCYANDGGGVGCGVRSRNNPFNGYRYNGFRVVLSPSTSGH